jgi:hypothetical protein
MSKEVPALSWAVELENVCDGVPETGACSLTRFSQQRLKFGKLFDGIEVGAVGRQVEQLGLSVFDRFPNAGSMSPRCRSLSPTNLLDLATLSDDLEGQKTAASAIPTSLRTLPMRTEHGWWREDCAEVTGLMPNDAESVRIRETVVLELAVLRDLLRSVTLTPADPPLPGTDIPVRRIAALIRPLARGRLDLSYAEAAFPALSRDQILRAFRHSRARPERDREPTADRLVTALDRIEQMWRSGKFGRGLVVW